MSHAENPDTPIVEILQPEPPPDYDTIIFLLMLEATVVVVFPERLIQGETL